MATDADLQAMQQVVSASLQTVIRDLAKLQERAKDAAGPSGGVGMLSTTFEKMTRTLAGPVGLAAGIYAVGAALNSFATNRLQVQNFAIDVGASVKMVDALGQSMRKSGISIEEGRQSILTLGGALKELSEKGVGSKLDEVLKNTGVKQETRQALIDKSRKDFDGAMGDLINILNNTGNAQVQSYRAKELGLIQSHVQAMTGYLAELGKVVRASGEDAKYFAAHWVEASTLVTNTWETLGGAALKLYRTLGQNKAIGEVVQRVVEDKGVYPDKRSLLGRALGFGRDGGASKRSEQENDKSLLPDWLRNIGPLGSIATTVNPMSALTSPGGAALNYFKLLGGPSSAHAATNPVGDLIRTEEDSNKSLRQIRDILQKWDSNDEDSVEGRGQGDAQGGRGGIFSRSSRGRARRQGGGGGDGGAGSWSGSGSMPSAPDTGSGGGGGGTPGGINQGSTDAPVGTGAFDRSSFDDEIKNNPGLLARLQTIVQGEVGHGAPAWKKRIALESIFNRATARGQSLEQVTKQYTGPGSAGYYPSSTFSGGRIRSQAEYDRFQSDVMGPVRGGSDESTARLGFPATGNASSSVAANGARNGRYTRYGQTEPGAYPGKPGIETWAQEGNWGRGGRGAREDIGRLEASRRKPGTRLNVYAPRDYGDSDPAGERATIDQSQSASGRHDAAMSAIIDFRNMPSWVNSQVESNGKFKDLRVNRGTPQDGQAGTVWGDTNRWSYE